MTRRVARFGLTLVVAAAAASSAALAQQQQPPPSSQDMLTGPVMGYLSDAAGVLYRLNGLPGSSLMARLGAAPGSVRFTRVSQQGRLALIATSVGEEAGSATQLFVARGLDRPEPEMFQISGSAAEPRLAAFCAASGDSAVLYSEAAGTLQLVRGLRGGDRAPELLAPVQIAGLGRVSALACHIAARSVVFAAGEPGNEGLYSAALGGEAEGLAEPKLAGPVGAAVAITPFEKGMSSLVLDAAGNRLLLALHGSGGMIQSIDELAGGAEGVSQPVGVAVTDSGLAALANAGTSSVLVFDIRTRQAVGAPLELPVAPTQCERLLTGDVFALGVPRAGAPLYTIDLAAEPRVVFTPAFHGDSQQ